MNDTLNNFILTKNYIQKKEGFDYKQRSKLRVFSRKQILYLCN